ncbi:DNA glycosylase [Terfezia claveryi]|nr:DNA glycosylase [Terfezia claveryi]
MSTRQLRSATRSKAAGNTDGTLNFKQNKATVAVPTVTKKPNKEPITRATKRQRDSSPVDVTIVAASTPADHESTPTVEEKKGNPKRQKLNKFPTGTTPFPDHPHPSPEEVQTVVDLLSGLHGVYARPPKPPLPNLLVAGCGEVPSVLDALIRTLLSASTSAQNSNRAFKGLVEKFGVCGKRGSVDWEKVRKATNAEVFDAIKPGGLANVKSRRIQKILQQVWEEAQARKKGCEGMEEKKKEERSENGDEKPENENTVINYRTNGEGWKQEYHGHQLITESLNLEEVKLADGKNSQSGAKKEISYESDDDLSLDYLHNLSDDAAMDKLTSFDGIGFKTASCVMLFCMSRDSFAVDTHVFRLARFLNWVPPDKANRETTFWHLDAKLPGEHKYALHQLFIKHGRTCKWCKAGGPLKYEENGKKNKGKQGPGNGVKKEEGEDSVGVAENEDHGVESSAEEKVADIPEKCPIEHLVKRFHGASKGRGSKWAE